MFDILLSIADAAMDHFTQTDALSRGTRNLHARGEHAAEREHRSAQARQTRAKQVDVPRRRSEDYRSPAERQQDRIDKIDEAHAHGCAHAIARTFNP